VKHLAFRSATFSLWIVLCGVASVAWAQNAFPLSSLIDPDVALYLEVAHPDRQWDAWERSELARRWKQTGLETLFAQSDFARHWRKVDEAVAQATPQTVTDHIRGLCGQGLSLAVFVPNDGPPQGLWVSRARSSAMLEATLKAWDTLEPPLKTERRNAGGVEFFARRIKKGPNEQVLYYARRDDVLILSDHERLVAACAQRLGQATGSSVDSDRATPPRSFLDEAEVVVPEASTVAVWMYGNPRAWDRLLDREFDHSPGAQLARKVWLSFKSLGASLRLDDGVTLTVAAALDPSRVHAGWNDAVDAHDLADPLRHPERPTILTAAADDAALVLGGSVRPAWWLQQLQVLQSDREKEDWRKMQRVLRGALGGLDPWSDVGAALFRDWGVAVSPRQESVRVLKPADWTIATLHQLTVGPDQRPEVVGAIDDALGLGMQLIAAQWNGDGADEPVTPTRIRAGNVIGRKMSGRPDREFGYEIAANQLRAGWPFADMASRLRGPGSQAAPTELAQLAAREFPHPALLAWVNVQRLRSSLKAAEVTDEQRVPLLLSRLVDRGFAAVSFSPQRVEFKLGGRFAP
jgi:hypothetical protein